MRHPHGKHSKFVGNRLKAAVSREAVQAACLRKTLRRPTGCLLCEYDVAKDGEGSKFLYNI
jgi:hypothetical protein